jgi:hypothetical protein
VPRQTKAETPKPARVHLLDTNIILRFLIGDDPPQAALVAIIGKKDRNRLIVEGEVFEL